MAHKKQGGKASQHISPSGKRLGVKISDGKVVKPGMIIVRQRGSQIHAGKGTKLGRDFTVYSIKDGAVRFGKALGKKTVSVLN